MQGVNLIPAHRLAARSRRLRIRSWAIGSGVYALLLMTLCIAAGLTWGKDTRSLASEVEYQTRQIADLNAAIKVDRGKAAEFTSALQTIKAVTEQPDWSVLLAMLGVKIGNDTVFSSIRLEPGVESNGSKTSSSAIPDAGMQPRRYNLELQGHARTQPAVTQLMQRLQETGLFDEVKLVRSGRGNFAGNEAFAFHLQCFIGEGQKRHP